MRKELNKLRSSLKNALDMIDKSHIIPYEVETETSSNMVPKLDFTKTTSLLDKCNNVEEQYGDRRPTIRIIHHLACSGGTLIAKCLSSLPSTFVLSEVHPLSKLHVSLNHPTYRPTDLISLSRYAGINNIDSMALEIFRSDVKIISEHVAKCGGQLLIRDHSHIDYCVNSITEKGSVVRNVLEKDFNVLAIATVRHPLENYISMKNSNWLGFSPQTLDEFSRRYLRFLKDNKKIALFKYEDFVESPQDILKSICGELELHFQDRSLDIFDIAVATGDSGRSGNKISSRAKKEVSETLLTEIAQSKHYKKLIKVLKYD